MMQKYSTIQSDDDYLQLQQVIVSDVERDLGILIDNKLTFHKQCSSAVAKVLRIICRSFEYVNVDIMLYLYKSLTRPIVEYGNIIWGPHYVIDQQLSYN